MTITLCNSHPFTFYLPFHTSLRVDQCPIQSHVPSACTLGLDPCARHSLFGRTDPYYIDNFYSSCGLKRLAATLASPFSVIVLSSQYLFQRGPIWIVVSQMLMAEEKTPTNIKLLATSSHATIQLLIRDHQQRTSSEHSAPPPPPPAPQR